MFGELKRILYIEDEPDIQAIARVSLESVGGFTTKICSSGEEGLQQTPLFDPQLILLDVMMPGMDGPATFQALHELKDYTNTPIIFMTAKAQPQEIQEYMSMGAIGVITKPFDPIKLPDDIRTIWNSKTITRPYLVQT